MNKAVFGCSSEAKVNAHAERIAAVTGRGEPNIEDRLSAALTLLSGLTILGHSDATEWEKGIDRDLNGLVKDVLDTEQGIRTGLDKAPIIGAPLTREVLVSFLMSFASRAASRERLHVFTTTIIASWRGDVISRACG